MAHKMLFNTGVKPESRLDKNGKVILMPYQKIIGGVLQIEYYLEQEPQPNWKLECLMGAKQLEVYPIQANQVAIKVVEGGMVGDYAIFTVLEIPHVRETAMGAD